MAFAQFDSSKTNQPMTEINMIPLIDVVLVLLIIFMVTAPMLTNTVNINLPEASSQSIQQPKNAIELSIDAQGIRYLNGQPLPRESIQTKLTQISLSIPQPEVYIKADKAINYQLVAETLADISTAGIAQIGFVSTPTD